jgi:hypothetical protein
MFRCTVPTLNHDTTPVLHTKHSPVRRGLQPPHKDTVPPTVLAPGPLPALRYRVPAVPVAVPVTMDTAPAEVTASPDTMSTSALLYLLWTGEKSM